MGAGHSHAEHTPLGPAPRQLRVLMALLVGPLVLATLVGLLLLWPDGDLELSGPGVDVQRGTATVTELVPCQLAGGKVVEGCQAATIDVLSGPGAGADATAVLPYGEKAP